MGKVMRGGIGIFGLEMGNKQQKSAKLSKKL